MKPSGFIISNQSSHPLPNSQLNSLSTIKTRDQNKDSIKPNFGSIQSSLKSYKVQILNKQQSYKEKVNSFLNASSKKSDSNQYLWQAVYIEGKFYLTDKQTVERYFQIENLLQEQIKTKQQTLKRLTKQQLSKNAREQINHRQKQNQFTSLYKNCKDIEAIPQVNDVLSDKQKRDDQSLLNNLNTSSMFPSSLTFENQISQQVNDFEDQQKIESLSSIDIKQSFQKQQSKQLKFGQNKTLVQQNYDQAFNKQTEYGYFLTTNNEKVFYKKNQNQDPIQLKNLSQSPSLQQSQNHLNNDDKDQNNSNRASSFLQKQSPIEFPIDKQSNHLKFGKLFQTITSQNKVKSEILHKITEEQYKKQPPQHIKFIKQKQDQNTFSKFKSLNKLEIINKININPQDKKGSKYFSTLQLKKQDNKLTQFKNSNYSNYQNISFIESNCEQNAFFNQKDKKQKQKSFKLLSVREHQNKLESLESNKSLIYINSLKKQSKSRNSHQKINLLLKKHELPKLLKQKNKSIDEKYFSMQKIGQQKLFQNIQPIQNYLQKCQSSLKSRFNGFITHRRTNSHINPIFQDSSSKKSSINQQNNQNNQMEYENQLNRKQKSSIITRNHFKVSLNQSQQTSIEQIQKNIEQAQAIFQSNKSNKKIPCLIGKLISPHQQTNQYNLINHNDHQSKEKSTFNGKIHQSSQAHLITTNQKVKKEVFDLKNRKQNLLQKLQNLQKEEIEKQIQDIKKSIREIEIHKLNKIARTIDLIYQNKSQQLQYNEKIQKKIKLILNQMPQQIKNINKPQQIANIIVPKELLQSTQQYKLSVQMSSIDLQQLAIRVYKLFGINYDPYFRSHSLLTAIKKPQLILKQKQKLVIKRFKNCVFFDIIGDNLGKISNKTIVWNFQELKEINLADKYNYKPSKKSSCKFYIGGWSSTIQPISSEKNSSKQSKGSKNGFGLQINQKYIYEGQYMNGKKHGNGKIFFPQTGYRYEGQFLENHKCGYGKQYISQKGELYMGQFFNDKRNGKGFIKKLIQQTSKNKNKNKLPYIFNGIFINGEKSTGHEFFQNGDQYNGEYSNNMLHGKGIYKWFDGSIYEGNFNSNCKQGFGKWSSSNDPQNGSQTFYIGQFKNNLKQGQGKYIYKNLAYYQGQFKNDLKDGAGALFFQNEKLQNKIFRGIWKRGNILANQKGEIYNLNVQKDKIQIQNPYTNQQ